MKPAPQGTLAYWGRGLLFSLPSFAYIFFCHTTLATRFLAGALSGLAWGLYEAYRGRQ